MPQRFPLCFFYYVHTWFFFRINSQIARIRSEETASKPPDISALEDDMEAAQEAASELEESLKKLAEQHDTAVEVNKLTKNIPWVAFFGVRGRM